MYEQLITMTMKDHSNPIHLAVSHINGLMKTEHIFCYASRTNNNPTNSIFQQPEWTTCQADHYDFLVITNGETTYPPGHYIKIERILDMTELSYTLVVHTLDEVIKAMQENNRFFHTVIKNAEMVFSKTALLPVGLSIAFDQAKDDQHTLAYSGTFCENLEVYTQIADISRNPHICVPILNKKLEQACLLLIYVMLGYGPVNYTLKGLLNLCSTIDRRCENIIPRITESDRYHFKLLTKGVWKGKYGKDREPITVYLHKACDDFTGLALEICTAKLKAI